MKRDEVNRTVRGRPKSLYDRAYHKALAQLARHHPAEFTRILDDFINAPARQELLREAYEAAARRKAS